MTLIEVLVLNIDGLLNRPSGLESVGPEVTVNISYWKVTELSKEYGRSGYIYFTLILSTCQSNPAEDELIFPFTAATFH